MNDEKNQSVYSRYENLASRETHVIFGGRLGTYRYTDMQDTVIAALDVVKKENVK